MDDLIVKQLEDLLQYKFKDINLLQKSLTHRSFDGENNERLEFLGDSILNFTIAEALFKKFPNIPEGDLSRLRASLVKSGTLAEIAAKIKLGDFIFLGEGELKSAGWRRPSILADTFEAIIGALYLDGGLGPAQTFIHQYFQDWLNEINPAKIDKDPKTSLQELLQSKKLMLPKYEVADIKGEAHAQEFVVKCNIAQLSIATEASGIFKAGCRARGGQYSPAFSQRKNFMTKKKCGKIAIIGQPNVGKSTLLNFILGQKLSITSRKAQTTRNQILGIHSEKDIQFIFVDTPGYQQKFLNQMNKRMNKSVTSVFHDVDVVIFMSEPKTLNEIEIELVKMIPNDTPVINLINKIDRVKNKNKILELIDINSELQIFKKIIPASIKLKDNQKIILQEIAEFLPEQDFIFDVDDITDKNERFLAAEIIREKIFRLTGDELPYSIAVEIENFEHKDNLRRIFAIILVDKDSQKPVVIGKDGEKLKRISTESRRDMEKLFQSKIWLEIWVKVQKNWFDDARALKSLGI